MSADSLLALEPLPLDFEGPTDRPFRPFPPSDLERSLFEIFAETAERHAEKTAIDDGETDLTYGEVLARARDLAGRIVAAVEPGAAVGIGLPIGVDYPIAMLAAMAAGSPFVSIDVNGPPERYARIVSHSGLQAIIVEDSSRAAAGRIAPGVTQLEMKRTDLARPSLPSLAADTVAAISYTSGSTGVPKGVFDNQRNVFHYAMQHAHAAHLSSEDRLMLLFSPIAAVSWPEIFSALLTGARLYVVDLRRKGVQEIIRTLRRGRVTIFSTLPSVLRQILKLCPDPEPLADVRYVLLTAERLFAADIEQFRRRFPGAYLTTGLGATEAKGFCRWVIPRTRSLTENLSPVGYVRQDFRVRLVTGDGVEVPAGEIGLIEIASRHLALGYWKDPEETSRVFSTAPDGMPVFRSGDLGRKRSDGLVELIGRADRQLRVRGQRVEPDEIEAVIRLHPAVEDAAVIARPTDGDIELVAYVVADRAILPSGESLRPFLVDRLPEALRPKHIRLIDEIPTLPTFKHDINALTALDRAEPARSAAVAAPTPPPDSVARAEVRARWQRLFGAPAVEADLAWEAAGGDSLKALEFVFELEVALKRPVPMGVLRPDTRPSDLIAALERPSRAVSVGAGTPVFYVPGYRGPTLSDMRFVQALAGAAEVKVLDFPPVDPNDLRFYGFDRIVGHVLAPMREAAASGEPVRILGYSYGCTVAFECARMLTEAGARVDFLGLIDAPALLRAHPYVTADAEPTAPDHHLRPSLGRIVTLVTRPDYFLMRLVRELMRRQNLGALRRLWGFLEILPMPRARLVFHESAKEYLRLKAYALYRPAHYAGALVLFRATDQIWQAGRALPQDMGWSEFCDAVRVVEIAGDHTSIFTPGRVAATAARVGEVLNGN